MSQRSSSDMEYGLRKRTAKREGALNIMDKIIQINTFQPWNPVSSPKSRPEFQKKPAPQRRAFSLSV